MRIPITSSEGSDSKLVWWLMGIFAAAILVLLSFSLSTLTKISERITHIEVGFATIAERQKQLETLETFMRREEQERILQVADIRGRLAVMEISLRSIGDQINFSGKRK